MAINKFLVCGVARAGKSKLGKLLKKELGVNLLMGDAIISSLAVFPDFQMSLDVSNNPESPEKFKELVKELLWHYDYQGEGYVLDTDHLRPHHIIDIFSIVGNIPTVFLGFAAVETAVKLKDIREYDTENSWTSELSDIDMFNEVERLKGKSLSDKEDCERLGIRYIDTGMDFGKSIQEAYNYLTSGL